jgi:hypothetical protein
MKRSIVSLGWIGVLALVAGLAACGQAPARTEATTARKSWPEQQARVPNEYLVTLAPGVDADTISKRFGPYGVRDVHELGDETYLVVLTRDPGPGELLKMVLDDDNFRALQPNIIQWTKRSGKQTGR